MSYSSSSRAIQGHACLSLVWFQRSWASWKTLKFSSMGLACLTLSLAPHEVQMSWAGQEVKLMQLLLQSSWSCQVLSKITADCPGMSLTIKISYKHYIAPGPSTSWTCHKAICGTSRRLYLNWVSLFPVSFHCIYFCVQKGDKRVVKSNDWANARVEATHHLFQWKRFEKRWCVELSDIELSKDRGAYTV